MKIKIIQFNNFDFHKIVAFIYLNKCNDFYSGGKAKLRKKERNILLLFNQKNFKANFVWWEENLNDYLFIVTTTKQNRIIIKKKLKYYRFLILCFWV